MNEMQGNDGTYIRIWQWFRHRHIVELQGLIISSISTIQTKIQGKNQQGNHITDI